MPERAFAPYVDVLLYPAYSITDAHAQTGQRYYTLAFITSRNGCKPAWGGVIPLADDHYRSEIEALRRAGGDVIVSFGGAVGVELGQACTSVSALQAAYQSVIDRYALTAIDFDIEGAAVADAASVDRRNRAIAGLQAANPGLQISYTLPVLPSGLVQSGLDLLRSAKRYGARVDVVNVMAMDYGSWAAPNPEGQMGRYAIDAGTNTYAQIQAIGLDAGVGITPMIGQNDVQTERFYVRDGEELLTWAKDRAWVKRLSMWSSNRDNGGCAGQVHASPSCSGIAQTSLAFTRLFAAFSGTGAVGTPPNERPTVALTSPAAATTVVPGAPLTLSASAADADGAVARVEFLVDDAVVGTDATSPYSITWSAPAPGTFVLAARAIDDRGATQRSGTVTVTADAVNGTCRYAAWAPGVVYVGGDRVAHAGREWEAKWWTQGDQPGTTGQWGVWKEVGPCASTTPSQPPVVAIDAPRSGAHFDEATPLAIEVSASDADGTITKVTFLANGTSVGTDATAPYRLAWTPPSAGEYTLTAVATSSDGGTTTSAAVAIVVDAAAPGDSGSSCGDAPAFVAGSPYKAGDVVANAGGLYRCEIAGWCSSLGTWAYAPGTGLYWNMAWSFVQSCSAGKRMAEAAPADLPAQLELRGNFPNPFFPSTQIHYALPEAAHVRLTVYDAMGRVRATLVDGVQSAGEHAVHFDASSLPSGAYLYRLQAGASSQVRQMMVAK